MALCDLLGQQSHLAAAAAVTGPHEHQEAGRERERDLYGVRDYVLPQESSFLLFSLHVSLLSSSRSSSLLTSPAKLVGSGAESPRGLGQEL